MRSSADRDGALEGAVHLVRAAMLFQIGHHPRLDDVPRAGREGPGLDQVAERLVLERLQLLAVEEEGHLLHRQLPSQRLGYASASLLPNSDEERLGRAEAVLRPLQRQLVAAAR